MPQDIFKDIVCPICKKKFICPSDTVYKMNKKGKVYKYCSYKCFRKAGGGK